MTKLDYYFRFLLFGDIRNINNFQEFFQVLPEVNIFFLIRINYFTEAGHDKSLLLFTVFTS